MLAGVVPVAVVVAVVGVDVVGDGEFVDSSSHSFLIPSNPCPSFLKNGVQMGMIDLSVRHRAIVIISGPGFLLRLLKHPGHTVRETRIISV